MSPLMEHPFISRGHYFTPWLLAFSNPLLLLSRHSMNLWKCDVQFVAEHVHWYIFSVLWSVLSVCTNYNQLPKKTCLMWSLNKCFFSSLVNTEPYHSNVKSYRFSSSSPTFWIALFKGFLVQCISLQLALTLVCTFVCDCFLCIRLLYWMSIQRFCLFYVHSYYWVFMVFYIIWLLIIFQVCVCVCVIFLYSCACVCGLK